MMVASVSDYHSVCSPPFILSTSTVNTPRDFDVKTALPSRSMASFCFPIFFTRDARFLERFATPHEVPWSTPSDAARRLSRLSDWHLRCECSVTPILSRRLLSCLLFVAVSFPLAALMAAFIQPPRLHLLYLGFACGIASDYVRCLALCMLAAVNNGGCVESRRRCWRAFTQPK